MPKQILNQAEIQEACAVLAGLSGSRAKTEAEKLARQFGCHFSRVYEATKHLRPKRKTRTDKGNRRVDLKEHAGMSFATSLVVGYNLDPDLALATARANGHDTPVSLGTYRRQLREGGLNRGQRRSRRVVYRSFQAAGPGALFQFDISGVKDRMVDVRNKRIIQINPGDVSANHPNRKSTRVKIWKFTIKDDYSRKMFTRFYATDKSNSCDVIDFLLEAFRVLGVPLVLYTDNDSVIVSRLMARAAAILDRAFAESGGFKMTQHLPYNSNATGKVENSHLWVEKFEKELGIGTMPTMEEINKFADGFCEWYNWREHSKTHEKPEIRFRAGHALMRKPPEAVLNDAFKAREFQVKVNPNVTISVDSKLWQLPRGARIATSLSGAKEYDNPFPDLAILAKTIQVIWPIEAAWFIAVAGGNEFEFPKVEAVDDVADEHKRIVETTAEKNTKHFTAIAQEQRKAARVAARRGEASPIKRPGIEVPFETAAEDRPAVMPRREVNPSLTDWAAAGGAVPSSAVGDVMLGYWQATDLLQELGEMNAESIPQQEHAWLKAVFGEREQISENELRSKLPLVIEPGQVVKMRTA